MTRLRTNVFDDTIDDSSDEDSNYQQSSSSYYEQFNLSSKDKETQENIQNAVMAAAKAWSNVLLDENGLCSVYCNEQVQYEKNDHCECDDGYNERDYVDLYHTDVAASVYDYDTRFENDQDYRMLSFGDSSHATRSSVRSLFKRLDSCNSSSTNFNASGSNNLNLDNAMMIDGQEQIGRFRTTLFDEDTLVETIHNRVG